MINVTPANFEAEVIEASRQRPVLVDFWAEWCGPCRMVGPVLEELEREGGGKFVLAKADVQTHPDLGARFQVSSIPAMKLFVDGKVVSEQVGALPKAQLARWIDAHAPGPEAERVRAGKAALAEGELDTAIEAFEAALKVRPDTESAQVGLALAYTRAGRAEEAARLAANLRGRDGALARVLADGARYAGAIEEPAATYGRALRAAADGDAELGLSLLLGVVVKHRKWGDDAARKRMLDLFEVLADRKDLVDDWRRKLGMALF